jgi:heat-inducible transcriptional repressor
MLIQRYHEVLLAVVESYIDRPSPVGSRYVSRKHGFSLSSATIRNIMADLEEMGYLLQPHTSAGRVPTDQGYRYFVDSLKIQDMDPGKAWQFLETRFVGVREDVEKLLAEATRELSSMSHCLAFAIPARPGGSTLNRIQFFSYMGTKVVCVLITNEGLVTTRILEHDADLSQTDLYRISDYLNAEFSGYTIDEIRAMLVKQLSKERTVQDLLINRALAICDDALSFPTEDIIFSGISELVGLPELSDKINELTRAIEDKQRIVRLLEGLALSDGIRVVIGSENPERKMRNLSIITAQYHQGNRMSGALGMIGPMRMDYPRAISLVNQMARYVTGAIAKMK